MVQGATTLYVGGSENIIRRLREHLCEAADKTTALNMRRWCPNSEGTIAVYVQTFISDVSRGCRQDLEDALWEELKPMFGNKGGR